ncbi:hypothetical protein Nepgr_027764 [Nepenthes gracilis]|uniref:Protein kinase domain-containing protein n=1 Tax=Nepenthes gracilis TaxID=150966 RepID=A0AAD3Y3V9_NEPGR|nr:hypothetical protein Nepgr_027764 [Nepenthes gracilis]
MRQRAKYFKRNGGLLLQQQMSSSEGGVVEKTRIFTTNELEKATDNFNENRVLGHGGQGTIYKGMLMDGRIVAVKKSKQVEEDQLEQFINEVVIVSQSNHRNVVKLLGCCLETEVPLLVYEFIPNGTLSQHIHNPCEDFHLTWNMRLQIAIESTGALTYLHSSSSTPIYHRDIKSSNMLLDDKHFGYLDPEYFQSNQFTEKSDVYSFGVVLVKLLTSKRPISATKPGKWRNLAHEFLFMMDGSRLLDILDGQLIQEGKKEDLWAVANLAKQCLNLNGKLRPTMKELAMALESVRSAPIPHLTQLTSTNNSDDAVAKMSKKRKEMRQRIKYFKRNSDLLLQQQMSSSEGGVVDKIKIFTSNELEKATKNFNKNRVLDRKGQVTVYKSMLMDGRIVATKKSKQVDEDQLE